MDMPHNLSRRVRADVGGACLGHRLRYVTFIEPRQALVQAEPYTEVADRRTRSAADFRSVLILRFLVGRAHRSRRLRSPFSGFRLPGVREERKPNR